tara:strand:- start:669 stop:1181 length:513 start_codon:yes stop_codon:yes gene_type:complete
MACDVTQGRTKVCKDGLGGQTALYLYNSIEDAFTVVAGEATAVNAGLTAVFKYELEGDGNTLEQSMEGSRLTGSRVNTQTLTTLLKKIDAATNAELNLLVAGYPQAVVEDRNGKLHALALDDGMDFTAVSSSGGAKADMNGYTLTGVATTATLAPILDSATATAFKALVA